MPYMKPYNASKQKGQAASLRNGSYKDNAASTQYKAAGNPHPYGRKKKRGGDTNGIGGGEGSGAGVGGAT